MSRKGWFRESYRHSLAARGIRTGRKLTVNISFPKRLFKNLLIARRPLTTKQIATRVDMNWITARRHLEDLSREGRIKKRASKKRIYWWI